MSKYVVPLLVLASAANAASLGDVKHVIMVMFENRSFNHVSLYGRRCEPSY
jgi:phospholipase C